MIPFTPNFKTELKKIFIALGICFTIVFVFCMPAFEGKIIHSTDGDQFNAMIQNMSEVYKNNNNEYPIWNRNLFSGMPFFFEKMELTSPFFQAIFYGLHSGFLKIFGYNVINFPAIYFLIAFIGFYILGSVLRWNYNIKIIGSALFSINVQMAVLVIAGHHTKLMSLALLPFVVTGFMLIIQKKYFVGSIIATLMLYLIISFEHYQMVLYVLITILFLCMAYLIYAFKNKIPNIDILKAGSFCLISVVLAFSFFYPKMISYEEYSKETIRSGSKIFDSKAAIKKTNGLDKNYAFAWSYGIDETLTFVAPNIFGGASHGILGENSNSFKTLTELGVPEDQATNIVGSFSTYWGNQPFTSGPIYLGVMFCILLVLSFFYLRSWLAFSLMGLTILCVMVAWGKNFAAFNYFLFDHIPYYNKFRAPTMILTVVQLSTTMLVCLLLQYFFVEPLENFDKKKFIKIIVGTAAIFFVFVGWIYANSNFKSQNDANLLQQFIQMTGGKKDIAQQLFDALIRDRKDLVFTDLLMMIVGSALLIAMFLGYFNKKAKSFAIIVGIGCWMFFENYNLSKKYLPNSAFQEKTNTEDASGAFPLTAIDNQILADKDPNYRVLDLSSQNLFSDASASYYHRSVGGYYAAKLAAYQDLIDSQISKMTPSVLNMLNTKYIITVNDKGQKFVQLNPTALGACWLVDSIKMVDDTKQEMIALNNFNPKKTAVIEKKYQSLLSSNTYKNEGSQIQSIYTSHDTMVYQATLLSPQLAVFSEMFYNNTWQAFLDNKEIQTIKANYVLRALSLPAGSHKITFINSLKTFKKGVVYQTIGSIAFFILLACMLYFEIYLPFVKNRSSLKK